MRKAILFTQDKDGVPTIVCGPEVPIDKQKTIWKQRALALKPKPGDETIVAELWESSRGRVKRDKWLNKSPKQAASHETKSPKK